MYYWVVSTFSERVKRRNQVVSHHYSAVAGVTTRIDRILRFTHFKLDATPFQISSGLLAVARSGPNMQATRLRRRVRGCVEFA